MAKNLVDGTNIIIEENADNINLNLSSTYTNELTQQINDSFKENNVYSTTETVVGTWMGKPLYRKVIDIGNLPNANSKSVNHGISNLGIVTKYYGTAESSDSSIPIPYTYPSATGANYGIGLDPVTSTTITVVTGVDRSGYTGHVVLEYTKTTD